MFLTKSFLINCLLFVFIGFFSISEARTETSTRQTLMIQWQTLSMHSNRSPVLLRVKVYGIHGNKRLGVMKFVLGGPYEQAVEVTEYPELGDFRARSTESDEPFTVARKKSFSQIELANAEEQISHFWRNAPDWRPLSFGLEIDLVRASFLGIFDEVLASKFIPISDLNGAQSASFELSKDEIKASGWVALN